MPIQKTFIEGANHNHMTIRPHLPIEGTATGSEVSRLVPALKKKENKHQKHTHTHTHTQTCHIINTSIPDALIIWKENIFNKMLCFFCFFLTRWQKKKAFPGLLKSVMWEFWPYASNLLTPLANVTVLNHNLLKVLIIFMHNYMQ